MANIVKLSCTDCTQSPAKHTVLAQSHIYAFEPPNTTTWHTASQVCSLYQSEQTLSNYMTCTIDRADIISCLTSILWSYQICNANQNCHILVQWLTICSYFHIQNWLSNQREAGDKNMINNVATIYYQDGLFSNQSTTFPWAWLFRPLYIIEVPIPQQPGYQFTMSLALQATISCHITSNQIKLHDNTRHEIASHDMTSWHDIMTCNHQTWHDRHGRAQYGMAWHSMVWHSTPPHGTAEHDMTHDMTWHASYPITSPHIT